MLMCLDIQFPLFSSAYYKLDLGHFDFLISIQTSYYHMFRFFTIDNVGQNVDAIHSHDICSHLHGNVGLIYAEILSHGRLNS